MTKKRTSPGTSTAIARRPQRTFELERSPGKYTAYGYRSARTADKEGRSAVGGSGDYHVAMHREKLLWQSREFMRDNSLYSGPINRAVNYMVPFTGHKSLTKSASWNEKCDALWREFWGNEPDEDGILTDVPDEKGILTGRQCEKMACREGLVAGDVGTILTNTGKIQIVEAEQITSSKFADGISKRLNGSPAAFYVSPYNSGGWIDKAKAARIEPEYFVFLTDPDRPSGVRSVPPAQSSFSMLHRISDVCDSEAIAWQLLARLAVSMTRQGGPALGRSESKANPDKSSTEMEGDLANRITEVGYAMIFHGLPGDEIKGIERNIPAQNFPECLRMFLRLLGLCTGLPLEIVLLDWTDSNYSQAVAVMEQTFKTFEDRQGMHEIWLRRIRNWKVDEWIRAGKLGPRPDRYRHAWTRPRYPWWDKLKEAQGHGVQIDRCFSTLSDVCAGLGKDRVDLLDVREQEIEEAIQRAEKIQKAHPGVIVPWEMFAGLKAEPAQGRPGGAAPAQNELKRDEKDQDKGTEDEKDE